MTNHLHVYDMKGRCIHSVVIHGDLTRCDNGIPRAVNRILRYLGMTLSHWNADERAGIAGMQGETHIVRIKADSMQRDMRAGGATAALEDIRKNAVEISAIDAWSAQP